MARAIHRSLVQFIRSRWVGPRERYMLNRELVRPIAEIINRRNNVARGYGNRNRQSEEGAIRALYGMHVHRNNRR